MMCCMRGIRFVLSAFIGVLYVSAKDARPNSALKLPIVDVTDRVFTPIAGEKELTHAWVGQIVQGRPGVLMVQHTGQPDSLRRTPDPPLQSGFRRAPTEFLSRNVAAMRCSGIMQEQSGLAPRIPFTGTTRSMSSSQLRQSRPGSFKD